MNDLYQSTFDQINMSEERVQSLRAELACRCSTTKTEVIPMKIYLAPFHFFSDRRCHSWQRVYA